MDRDFVQHDQWNEQVAEDWRQLLALAVREDLDTLYDWTTVALVPAEAQSRAAVVARESGVVAGLPAVEMTLAEYDRKLQWSAAVVDGATVAAGESVGVISGPARSILTAERPLLNVLGRLSGVATLTRRYVDAVAGTKARIYDTRKTTPGWRRLEKYAVRQGGGRNHRTGLYDAVLIKDNHLAFGQAEQGGYSPAQAVRRARDFVAGMLPPDRRGTVPIEVEVDTLEQLREVLAAGPDLVLLDNMPPDVLRQAVALRDASHPGIELEASGGIRLETVGDIAQSGIERISVGGLTHSARTLDFALDWLAA